MRKQIKFVAVLSTTAFLAMCSSLISFAAGGWTEENGGWSYYDEKGERIAENWVKNKNQWYWMDEKGTMVSDGLFQINEDYYYFWKDGSMASEEWISIPGEGAGKEGEPEQYWYYFQKDGRAYRHCEGAGPVEIGGKQYFFDAQGRMIDGQGLGEEGQAGEESREYYDAKGERITEDWVQSGNQWYWVDEKGAVVCNRLIQVKNDYYYLKEDGSMASEEWIAIPNENAGEENEPEQYWYYFQKNGKAYRRSDGASSGSIKAKTIDGKKYAFDTEGRMLYGWVADGERQTGEDAWEYCDYYFGTEDDGVMRQGWARLSIDAGNVEDLQPGYDFWDEDQERWFYFNANGKKVKGSEDGCRFKTISGNKYGFDEYGRMIVSWYADPNIITLATSKSEAGFDEDKNQNPYQGQPDYTRKFMYFGPPEAGAKYVNGWFTAIPSEYLMKSKYDDQETAVFYADKDGNLSASEIKTIDGEKYGFDLNGRVMSGLRCVIMESASGTKRITGTFGADASETVGKGPYSEEEEFDELVEMYADAFWSHKMRFYYFGGTNGAMLTGKQQIPLIKGGEKYDFMFETSGRYKGSGVYGERDGRLYKAGKLIKPDEGEKFAIIKESCKMMPEDATKTEKEYMDPDGDGKINGILTKITVKQFMEEVCNSGIYDEDRDEKVWTVRYEPEGVKYYLIGYNGNIIKNKNSVTDGDGYRFKVKNKKIQTITEKY